MPHQSCVEAEALFPCFSSLPFSVFGLVQVHILQNSGAHQSYKYQSPPILQPSPTEIYQGLAQHSQFSSSNWWNHDETLFFPKKNVGSRFRIIGYKIFSRLKKVGRYHTSPFCRGNRRPNDSLLVLDRHFSHVWSIKMIFGKMSPFLLIPSPCFMVRKKR